MAMKTGVSNLHYAILSSDTSSGIVYGTPVSLPKVAEITVQTASDSTTFYADNGPAETASALGEITVELNVADLDLDTQAALLGHTVTGGVLVNHKDDTAPYVAIMFEALKSNGSKRYVKLLKGQFSEPEDAFKTKGESVEFQPMTISGTFVVREYDGNWKKTADEDHADYVSGIGSAWYTSVESSADTTAPTVTCVPADAATGVAVDASIVLTFSEAISTSTLVIGESFVVVKDDGTVVAGAGTWDTDHEVYTFNPTSNLDASSNYNVIVTTAVKDLAGNALAAVNIFNFTTA